jgi:hypothetical protein
MAVFACAYQTMLGAMPSLSWAILCYGVLAAGFGF